MLNSWRINSITETGVVQPCDRVARSRIRGPFSTFISICKIPCTEKSDNESIVLTLVIVSPLFGKINFFIFVFLFFYQGSGGVRLDNFTYSNYFLHPTRIQDPNTATGEGENNTWIYQPCAYKSEANLTHSSHPKRPSLVKPLSSRVPRREQVLIRDIF